MNAVARQILEAGLVVIIRADRSDHLAEAARALWEGGVRVMEVTLNTPGALGAIEAIRGALPGMVCGAGTILTVDDAVAARGAGAQFVITPTLQLDTIGFCKTEGLAVSPGCASLTEMVAAQRAGADFVKVFPANRFGLVHMREVLEEAPGLRLIPTGGVTAENVGEYFEAGCAAVAAGSTLVSKEALADHNWAAITAVARQFVGAVHAARGREVRA
jgi:2-dehydro-3-deoxyphosphogluconate aldolase/(4S)-4-hydroxy-2-oxoglutarate aldolase